MFVVEVKSSSMQVLLKATSLIYENNDSIQARNWIRLVITSPPGNQSFHKK